MATRKKVHEPRSSGLGDVEIGARIRALRIDADISQEKLGSALGVSFQQVQKYERGVNRLSLTRAIHIAKILKTSIGEIAGNEGSKELVHGPAFNLQRYRLAQSFDGLDEDVLPPLRSLIEAIKNGGKKKR